MDDLSFSFSFSHHAVLGTAERQNGDANEITSLPYSTRGGDLSTVVWGCMGQVAWIAWVGWRPELTSGRRAGRSHATGAKVATGVDVKRFASGPKGLTRWRPRPSCNTELDGVTTETPREFLATLPVGVGAMMTPDSATRRRVGR